MKCPFQTKVLHKPKYTEGYVQHFAEDITTFGNCLKFDCPFYYTSNEREPSGMSKTVEHCRKVESGSKE